MTNRAERHPRNLTSVKALDRVARDPRVTEVRDEGPDGDERHSYWVDLARGYNWEGCISLHESTATELIARLDEIEED